MSYHGSGGKVHEFSEQPNGDTMTLPKDHTMRTDQPNFAQNRLEIGPQPVSNDEIDGSLTANLNLLKKRYRREALLEDSRDLIPDTNHMQKIRVTKVVCDELSQPAYNKRNSDSCIPQEGLSNYAMENAAK